MVVEAAADEECPPATFVLGRITLDLLPVIQTTLALPHRGLMGHHHSEAAAVATPGLKEESGDHHVDAMMIADVTARLLVIALALETGQLVAMVKVTVIVVEVTERILGARAAVIESESAASVVAAVATVAAINRPMGDPGAAVIRAQDKPRKTVTTVALHGRRLHAGRVVRAVAAITAIIKAVATPNPAKTRAKTRARTRTRTRKLLVRKTKKPKKMRRNKKARLRTSSWTKLRHLPLTLTF